jgi:hypothetical protein
MKLQFMGPVQGRLGQVREDTWPIEFVQFGSFLEMSLRPPESECQRIRMMDMYCVTCGCEMRRLMRESFMQRKVYPLFGYYPWECPLCRELVMFKARHVRKRKSKSSGSQAADHRFAKPSGRVSSGISEAKTS